MNYMTVVEVKPKLEELTSPEGKKIDLFVFKGLQRNPPEDRNMLAEIIKEYRENDHSPKPSPSGRK